MGVISQVTIRTLLKFQLLACVLAWNVRIQSEESKAPAFVLYCGPVIFAIHKRVGKQELEGFGFYYRDTSYLCGVDIKNGWPSSYYAFGRWHSLR
jgi:hypothetical protein